MKIVVAVLFLIVVLGFGFLLLGGKNLNSELTLEQSEKIPGLSNNNSGDSDYSGGVIAGSVTPYKVFTKEEYDQAIADGKVIFLNFYANWCPICRAEAPDLVDGFNKLNNPNVVGFRVNFKDDETDEFEGKLALEHGITYQHSKVIIKEGQVIYRQIAEKWDSNKVLSELGSI